MKIYRSLPGSVEIAAFIAVEKDRDYTYPAVGQTAEADARVAGFDHDRQRVAVGSGPDDFDRAKKALRSWVHFPSAWTGILPPDAPIQTGNTIAMFFRMFGCWWRNSCRIVYVIDEPERFGFAYGTLPAHLERGEEIFLVEMDGDGTVWYELQAFSRPRALLARLAYPYVRLLQEKFRQDSALAVQQFIRDKGAENEPVLPPDYWLLRFLFFLIAAVWLWPGSAMSHDYGRLPLAFAMLLVVPAGLLLAARHFPATRKPLRPLWPLLLPAALAATVSLGLPNTRPAGALMLPWVVVCGWVAGVGAWSVWRECVSLKSIIPLPALTPPPTPPPKGRGDVPAEGKLPSLSGEGLGVGLMPGEGSGPGLMQGERPRPGLMQGERPGPGLMPGKGPGPGPEWRSSALALSAGFLNLLIAGLAALADRIGYHPFGFGDDIIRLTALHFHFAGFALPVLAGATVIFSKDNLSRFTACCVALGVPLTAVGITATQLHWGPFLEIFSAAFMALAGLLAGVAWATLGIRRRNGWLQAAGIVLGGSMALALAYALRVIAPDFVLSIDQMRAVHGTLNGFVAVPLALIGMWRLGFKG